MAVVRAVMIAVLCALASPSAASAQAAAAPERASRSLLLFGLETSRPLHAAASVGTLIALRPIELSDDFGSTSRTYQGVIVEAAVGAEGFGLAAGWGLRMQDSSGDTVFGNDIMATCFRARWSLRGEATNATYVGAEVGLTTLFLPNARVSVGAARRVSGPKEADRTILTWGIGVHIGK